MHRCLISVPVTFLTTLQLNFHTAPGQKCKSDHGSSCLKSTMDSLLHLASLSWPTKINRIWPLPTNTTSSLILSFFHSLVMCLSFLFQNMSNSFLPQSLSVSVCLPGKPFLHIFKCLLPTSSNLYSAITSSQRVLFPQKHSLCPHHCPLCCPAPVFFIAILATWSYIICLLIFCFIFFYLIPGMQQ